MVASERAKDFVFFIYAGEDLMDFRRTASRLFLLTISLTLSFSAFHYSTKAQESAHATPSSSHSQAVNKVNASGKRSRPQRTFDILHYTIHTSFDVPNKTVMGDVIVTLKPLSAAFQSFTLDASSMKIEAVTLSDSNKVLQWSQPPDKLAIILDRAYEPSETIAVRVKYQARPERGLYFIPQTPSTNALWSKPAQIWTQGEPEDNHHWFPCYDYPDDKATSEQYITTGADEIAISNGTLIETISNSDSTRTFHWKMDEPHATYLTSLIVGNYVKLSDTYKNIPLEYYTYRGTEEVARRAFSKTPEMMHYFEQKLGYDYPYKRYAQTIVANFMFGGMENITATTHADTEILYGSSREARVSTENLISHELAHSWFGNLVTCKDWSELWLNEGLATFMEAAFREQQAGREAYLQEMRTNAMLYFLEDSLKDRHPLVNEDYRSPIDVFNSTVYKKGAFVIHMLREQVGDTAFWKSLNRYLSENQNKVVETRDLQRAFEETTGRELDWFFDQWVYKAGFPELRVRSFYHAPTRRLTLEVTQTQKASAVTPDVFRLPMEIEISTASGQRTERLEITARQQRFVFKLDGKPTKILFDKGERILKKIDFPQSASALQYQLAAGIEMDNLNKAYESITQKISERVTFELTTPMRSLLSNLVSAHSETNLGVWLRKASGERHKRPETAASALLISHDSAS